MANTELCTLTCLINILMRLVVHHKVSPGQREGPVMKRTSSEVSVPQDFKLHCLHLHP